jgi:hypothetical protein
VRHCQIRKENSLYLEKSLDAPAPQIGSCSRNHLSAASTPTLADEMVQSLGPGGPNDTILATFGDKRVIAFYQQDTGRRAVSAVVCPGA